LTDYGLAPINANPNLSAASPINRNLRWLAPEIINPPDTTNTVVESKAADVFAFGIFAIELFTGRLPFEGFSDLRIARQILEGGRPGLPENAGDVGLTPPVWELLQWCWNQDPVQRPTMLEVLRSCEALLGNNQYVQTIVDEFVFDPDGFLRVLQPTHPLGGTEQPTRPSKYTLTSQFIARSPVGSGTICRLPKGVGVGMSFKVHKKRIRTGERESPRTILIPPHDTDSLARYRVSHVARMA
jgi:serine/threonine protein kinase